MADFTVGFFLTAVAHLFLALISVCGYLVRQVGKVIEQRRPTGRRKAVLGAVGVCASAAAAPREKTETERAAVEALVSLGMPRHASERRVTQVVSMYGVLPIEELLRKALG